MLTCGDTVDSVFVTDAIFHTIELVCKCVSYVKSKCDLLTCYLISFSRGNLPLNWQGNADPAELILINLIRFTHP